MRRRVVAALAGVQGSRRPGGASASRRSTCARRTAGPRWEDRRPAISSSRWAPAGSRSRRRATGAALEARRPEGTHFQKPGDRRMQGSFVIAGPGVAAGADLGVIQQVDIAPTLAALLGMDPLAHAVGKPLPAAMAHKP